MNCEFFSRNWHFFFVVLLNFFTSLASFLTLSYSWFLSHFSLSLSLLPLFFYLSLSPLSLCPSSVSSISHSHTQTNTLSLFFLLSLLLSLFHPIFLSFFHPIFFSLFFSLFSHAFLLTHSLSPLSSFSFSPSFREYFCQCSVLFRLSFSFGLLTLVLRLFLSKGKKDWCHHSGCH